MLLYNFNKIKNIGIIGTGGFSREIISHMKNIQSKKEILTDLRNNSKYKNINDINLDDYNLMIGIGDPNVRKDIYNIIKEHKIFSYIHDKNNLLDIDTIHINEGSFISKGAVLTTNIKLGICCHINLNSTIGHDVTIGDFFTCSPGVNISGNCNIGNNVFIGTNATVKENITICDNVIIGMNSNVNKDITEPGIYFGNPIRKK